MNEIPDRVLAAYVAGALDGARARDVEDRMAASADVRLRLAEISASWQHTLAARTPPAVRWRMPPAGWPSSAMAVATVAVMGSPEDDVHRPGDRLRLSLPVDAPQDDHVVVLWRGAEDWEVLWPRREPEWVPVSRLPEGADGRRQIDVRVRDGVVRQSWSVVLLPSDAPIRWETEAPDRWAEVRSGVARGRWVVLRIDLDVTLPDDG